MTSVRTFRSLATAFLLCFTLVAIIIPLEGPALSTTTTRPTTQLTSVTPAAIGGLPQLGISCGLGTTQAVVNASGYPVGQGDGGTGQPAISSGCTWIGDVGASGQPPAPADTTTEPLVTDQDETYSILSSKIGGGFTADIVFINNRTSSINGFDITLSWNPKILRAVGFDQGGLGPWAQAFTVLSTIDNALGTARLSQVIFTPNSLNQTIFRIRYDVIGVGNTALTFSNDAIQNPGSVTHQTVNSAFDSETYFDPGHTLGWTASFTVSPNPMPGSPITFTATATCTGCTGTLVYRWHFNSTQTIFTTGNPVTITPTPPQVDRVALNITDAASHNVTIVQRLPLAPKLTGSNILAVNSPGTWNIVWIGGQAPLTGTWRFCPGTGTTGLPICAKPNPAPAPTYSSGAGSILLNATTTPMGAYHYAGVYNDSLTLVDSPAPVLPGIPNQVKLSFFVNVTGTPQAYVVTATTPTNATVGTGVIVTASVAYAGSYPAAFKSTTFTYTIAYGDGNSQTVTGGVTISASHIYSTSGTYTVRVIARETSIVAASKIQEVGYSSLTVSQPISGDFTFSPASPSSGQSVSFTTSITGGQSPLTFSWSFGDGTTGTGASTTHTFSSAASFNVTLTVTDAAGRSFTVTHMVTVVSGSDSSTLIIAGGGIGAIVAVAAALLFLRRRKTAKKTPV